MGWKKGNTSEYRKREKRSTQDFRFSGNKANDQQMEPHKMEPLCTVEEMKNWIKRQRSEWKKTFAGYAFERALLSGLYTKLRKLNSPQKKKHKRSMNMRKISNLISHQASKTTLRFHLTPVRMLSRKQMTVNVGGGEEHITQQEGGTHYTGGGRNTTYLVSRWEGKLP